MPYTLEQLDTAEVKEIYLEYRRPEYSSGYRNTAWVRAWMASRKSPNRALYGKTWRCWEHEPNAKEASEADWRD